MLRNAIDHGIEDHEQRLQAKTRNRTYCLDIGRQGTDIVVTFSDDGKGIDVNRIRDKAIKTGLMTTDQNLIRKRFYSLSSIQVSVRPHR